MITSMRIRSVGPHEHVSIWIRGQNVGDLVVGKGDGPKLVAMLMPRFSVDTSKDGLSRIYRVKEGQGLKRATCSSCGAPIVWAQHHQTGKAAPMNEEPSPDGNILLSSDGRYRVIPEESELRGTGKLHTNHFANCPNARSHRKSSI